MTLTGLPQPTTDNGDGSIPVELQRDLASRAIQERRPLADKTYVQEYAEHVGVEDGRYLHEVLDKLTDEVSAMMLTDALSRRELAMIQTKLTEAKFWAIELGIRKNRMYILDRRRFQEIENATVQ